MSGLRDRERFGRDHRRTPRRLSGYLDGELAPADRVRIERHLGECAECRRLLADLRRILDGLHRLPPLGPGVDAVQIAARVRVRVSQPD